MEKPPNFVYSLLSSQLIFPGRISAVFCLRVRRGRIQAVFSVSQGGEEVWWSHQTICRPSRNPCFQGSPPLFAIPQVCKETPVFWAWENKSPTCPGQTKGFQVYIDFQRTYLASAVSYFQKCLVSDPFLDSCFWTFPTISLVFVFLQAIKLVTTSPSSLHLTKCFSCISHSLVVFVEISLFNPLTVFLVGIVLGEGGKEQK